MEALRSITDIEKDKKKKPQEVNIEENINGKQNEEEGRKKILEEEGGKPKLNNLEISQFNLDTKEEIHKIDDDKKKDNEEEKKTKEEDLIRKDKTLNNNNNNNNKDLNLKSLDENKKKDDKDSPNLINPGFLESGLKHWGVSTEFKGVNNVIDFKASTFHTGSYLQGNFFNNTAPSLTVSFGLLKGLHSRHKQISNSITQAIEYAREKNISVFESFKHIKLNLMSSKKFATFRPTYTKKVFFSKGRKMGNITVIR